MIDMIKLMFREFCEDVEIELMDVWCNIKDLFLCDEEF